jgi:hypothetical protein
MIYIILSLHLQNSMSWKTPIYTYLLYCESYTVENESSILR